MGRKVTITVPDALREAMDLYKDRINFSKVCQEALRAEVQRLQRRDDDVETAAVYLRRLSRGESLTLAEQEEIRRLVDIYDREEENDS